MTKTRRAAIAGATVLVAVSGFGATRLVSGGADDAGSADALPSEGTATFTNINTVTFPIPTVTETVTVTAPPPTTEPPPTTTEPPPTTTEPEPDPASVVVEPGESINAAIDSLGSLGGTVLLRGGNHGAFSRFDDTARSGYVNVESYPNELAVVSSLSLERVERLRWKNIRNTGTTSLANGSKFVELLDGEYRGRIRLQRSGSTIQQSSDLTIRGNWIHDFSHTGENGSINGYGIISNTKTNERMVIADNLIENLDGGDGIQFASTVKDSVISGNTIRNIQPAFGSHSDVVQIVAHSERLQIINNRFLDSAHPVRVAPSQAGAQTLDLLFAWNLIDGIDNVAVQIAGDVQRARIENNTFTNYDFDPRLTGDRVVVKNIFDGPYSHGGDNYVGPVASAPAGYGCGC